MGVTSEKANAEQRRAPQNNARRHRPATQRATRRPEQPNPSPRQNRPATADRTEKSGRDRALNQYTPEAAARRAPPAARRPQCVLRWPARRAHRMRVRAADPCGASDALTSETDARLRQQPATGTRNARIHLLLSPQASLALTESAGRPDGRYPRDRGPAAAPALAWRPGAAGEAPGAHHGRKVRP
jgi:hypothetical protein